MPYTFYKEITTVNRTVMNNKKNTYIVIHYTGNRTDSAKNNAAYFKSVNRKASAHYFVDKTSVYQVVEDKDASWAVGVNYGSHVYRHYDICSKLCPGWTGWVGSDVSLWNKLKSSISAVQTWLNTYYQTGLTVDGLYGPKTKAALVKAWQTEAGGLAIDGIFGAKSRSAASSHVIRTGSAGIFVTLWQAYLVCRQYAPNGIDGIFGKRCHAATAAFQSNNGLTPDGQVGQAAWTKALC